MSKKFQVTVPCPQCGKEFEATLFRSIHPAQRERVFDNTVNIPSCTHCGAFIEIGNASLLYHDTEKLFAVWYEPVPDSSVDRDKRVFEQLSGGAPNYLSEAPRIQDWEEFKETIVKYETGELKPINPEALIQNFRQQNVASQIPREITPEEKRLYKIIGGIVVVLLLFWGVYAFYLAEYFAYKNVLSDRTLNSCYEYYGEYPNGRYMEEVKMTEIKISNNIQIIREFLREYPKSKYLQEVVKRKNKLWDKEIAHYEASIKDKEVNPKATEFFRTLLTYMKDKNLSEIYVQFNGHVDLKDYEDYSEDVKKLLEMEAVASKSETINGHVLALKENFTAGDTRQLEEIVDEGIKKSFEQVFSKGFLSIKPYSGASEQKNPLIIDIDYHIKNQIFEYEGVAFPNIWTYTTNNIFEAYILGISVDFNFDFKIPKTEQVYAFELKANPGDQISNISNIQEGYIRMTAMTFADYANNISTRFGLKTAYFNEEAETPVEAEK